MIEKTETKYIKETSCPYCNGINNWNTSDEETVMGNRIIKCVNCKQNIIVPFCNLFFNKNNVIIGVKYKEEEEAEDLNS